LKNEFAAELNEKAKPRLNLSDIRDDPWFWGIGRPLAIAASVAVFGLLSAILIGTYSRRDSEKSAPTDYIVEAEQNAPNQLVELPAADRVPNPLSAETIKRVERVVIGEINVETRFQRPELRVIETINDGYRIERLKQRLAAPAISRETKLLPMEHSYGLVFLDHQGQIVASARFCRAGDSGFVLLPMKYAYEQAGRYFLGVGAMLPGDWRPDIDYNQYVIQFPDWVESIGYAPGA
jgi:hypothetical protein